MAKCKDTGSVISSATANNLTNAFEGTMRALRDSGLPPAVFIDFSSHPTILKLGRTHVEALLADKANQGLSLHLAIQNRKITLVVGKLDSTCEPFFEEGSIIEDLGQGGGIDQFFRENVDLIARFFKDNPDLFKELDQKLNS